MSKMGSESQKPTHHYGRGGAGNVTSKDKLSPVVNPTQTTPTLKSNVYPTGRGGTGNMAKNDFGEEAREAQDLDVPGITLAEGEHLTGRGGAGNKYKPTEAEAKEARAHNQKVRKESFSKLKSKEGLLKALGEKGKEMFPGKEREKSV